MVGNWRRSPKKDSVFSRLEFGRRPLFPKRIIEKVNKRYSMNNRKILLFHDIPIMILIEF
jgi:hypothetical protein